jgi:hypothetical protein
MAQIFKSKELTFSVSEKEPGQQFACIGITHYYSTFICHPYPCIYYTCTRTPIYWPPIYPTCSDPLGPIEQEISEIKDAETLEMLRERLNSALKDVEGKLKETKGK